MRRKTKLPELLAPAGSMPALVAAVNAGADAVYVGGKSFSARAFAKNFDTDELTLAVRYCHLRGVKLYVTVNTLIYDKELDSAVEYVRELYKIGVDAIIAADTGLLYRLKNELPEMEVHLSTQLSLNNTLGVDFAGKVFGAKRAVLARESSLENIKSATENSDCEIEVFLHGALCVCHSGQCLFSSLVGGRSGNRGECAQPCRLPYNNGKAILSLKDLSLANHVRELIDAGVASLKIEGRMKSPEYVYGVTKIYRDLLDEYRNADQKETRALERIFSRGGFTDAYFDGQPQKEGMIGVRSESDKEDSRAQEAAPKEIIKTPVKAVCEVKRDKAISLTLYNENKSVSVYGIVPSEAINAPLTDISLKERLSKMGNTLLSLKTEDIELNLDSGLIVPISEINGLRRRAADAFESTERELPEAREKVKITRKSKQSFTSAVFYCPEKSGVADGFDAKIVPLHLIEKYISSANGVYIPPVIYDSEMETVRENLKRARANKIEYALATNISHIPLLKEYGFKIIGDFRLNVYNSYSAYLYSTLSVDYIISQPELTLPMARDIGCGVITLGRIPLMLTERCFIKDNFGCDKCGKAMLKDRTGAHFPIIREYGHRNQIMNSVYTYMGDKSDEIKKANITHTHFIFSTETPKEIELLLTAYKNKKPFPLSNLKYRRIGKR